MLLASLKNLQRWTRIFAFWYFACAFLLTNWSTFERTTFTFQNFLESDLLGLKHMMHASFVLGGVRSLGTTGNRRYLEIVAAVTLLSSFPSLVATVLTLHHFLQTHPTANSVLQFIICLGMLVVTSFSAYYALTALQHSENTSGNDHRAQQHQELLTWLGTKTSLVAVSSLQSRMRSASLMFEKTVGKIKMIDWQEKSSLGFGVLYFEIAFHFITNIVYLSQRMQPYGTVGSLRMDETVGSLVESTSLALHWGFLMGNAFHGLRSYSPQCLDIYCWGKILLVGASVLHHWSGGSGGSGGGSGGGGGLSTVWIFLEVLMHVLTVVVIRRVRFSIGSATPTHETIYSCHTGTLSAKEEHAISLWDASTQHLSMSGNGNTFRWYWFGRSAALFALGCFIAMSIQCMLVIGLSVYAVKEEERNREILRTYGVGMNFAIHAAAMCMLALYRPTRDRFAYEHSRSFNIGVCMLFCALFVWQIVCAWFSQRLILNYVLLFNTLRIFVYAACGTSFWLTPRHMPDLLMLTARSADEGPCAPVRVGGGAGESESESDGEAAVAINSTNLDIDTFKKTSFQNWLVQCCVAFAFVHWSGSNGVGSTYNKSNVKTLPLSVKSIIVRADQWTRISFWLYVVLAVTLSASDGYWLGSHGTRPFVNIGCLTMPSQICFHYCFILTGYALKGLRSPHVPMLKLICSCTAFIVSITMMTSLLCVYVSQYWLGLQLGGIGVALGMQCWACWVASVTMSKSPRMFVKSGVSHNWM